VGLPPAFVVVGDLDRLLDEDIAYARRLIAAGVPTDLHILAGAPHAFPARTPPLYATPSHGEAVVSAQWTSAPPARSHLAMLA
jgi:acetyl esterase/lipase